jgi:hypothetical protein
LTEGDWSRGWAGAVLQLDGSDGADRKGGHDYYDVLEDRGVEVDPGLVQAEAAFAEFLFHRPSQPRRADRPALGLAAALRAYSSSERPARRA